MDHQPFRDWLLSEEKLTTDQTLALNGHLTSCPSCCEIESSWTEVKSAIRKTALVEPMPGFTDRWQTHLSEYRQRKQVRKGWFSIGLTVVVTTVLFALLVTQIIALIQAPGPYLAVWFNRLVGVVSIYYTLQDFVSPFNWGLSIYTFVGMFFLVGIMCFICVLWLATYRKLSMERRLI